jgi:hypothetical protein
MRTARAAGERAAAQREEKAAGDYFDQVEAEKSVERSIYDRFPGLSEDDNDLANDRENDRGRQRTR